jgi:hypothetical protein
MTEVSWSVKWSRRVGGQGTEQIMAFHTGADMQSPSCTRRRRSEKKKKSRPGGVCASSSSLSFSPLLAC